MTDIRTDRVFSGYPGYLAVERECLQSEAASTRAERQTLNFAEQFANAAFDGRVEEARQGFIKVTDGTTNLQVLSLASDFFLRTGDIAMAKEMIQRRLAICGRDTETLEMASALCHLGLLYHQQGELDQANEMHIMALAIDLQIRNEKGIARDFGNLGVLNSNQGRLVRAEKMLKKALTIHKKLGVEACIARDVGNIGVIYYKRGELDRAEEFFQKALAINEGIGQQECMATNYGNLGSVANLRNDHRKARDLWLRALDLSAKLGMAHKVKELQRRLDALMKSEDEQVTSTGSKTSDVK